MRVEPVRAVNQFGHIEVGMIDPVTFTIVNAGATFYSWIHKSPDSKLSIFDIFPDLNEAAVHQALQGPDGECELERECIGDDDKRRIIRFRICRQDRENSIGLRLFAVDVSELRRKDAVLRSVSALLQENREVALQSKRNLKAIIDSLPQAVFSINSGLIVTSETSPTASNYFGGSITDRHIRDFTTLSDDELDPLKLAFSGVDWDLVIDILPKQFSDRGRTYALQFSPILDNGELSSVTIVVDDVTERRKMLDLLEETNAHNRSLVAILSAKDEFIALVDAARRAAQLVDDRDELRMTAHTLKGGFCLFECDELAALCQTAERAWGKSVYSAEQGREFVDCLNKAIDRFLDQNREILQIRGSGDRTHNQPLVRLPYEALSTLRNTAISHNADSDILRMIEQLLETPVSDALGWLDPLWQKTLIKEGKAGYPIVWSGEAVVGRDLYTELFQSFVHIIRNAVDHAIELPFERKLKGKDPTGRFEINSAYMDGVYTLRFSDDGRGIDPKVVVEMARKRGVDVPPSLTDREILMLLCESGLSSKQTVTHLSGLGLGLDVVRRRAQSLGGGLEIESEFGKGTTIRVWFKRASTC
jgi:signal transduction histidine kinase